MLKHFLKGVVVMVIVMVVNIIINIVCNMNGIDLNSTWQVFVSALFALLLYQGLIKKEKNEDNQKNDN